MSNFSFSHSVFYSFGELCAIFHQILNCHLQTPSVWRSLKCLNFVVLDRVKTLKGQYVNQSFHISMFIQKNFPGFFFFVAFVKDNATMNSILYFEDHV